MQTKLKSYFCLIFLFLFTINGFAQEKQRRMLYREFSFSTQNLFQHVPILPFQEANFNSYDLLYRWRKWNKRNTNRWAFTGEFIIGNSTVPFNSFILRWGQEWHYKLQDNWTYYLGFDILGFAQNQGDQSGLGTGPIGGLRFKINDRIFLSTESSIYLTFSSVGFRNNLTFDTRPPSLINLNIRFF